jgi:DNA repair protein RadC
MEPTVERNADDGAKESGALTTMKCIREVRVNYRGPKLDPRAVHASGDAVDFIRKILPDNSREHFIALFLDGAHQIISYAVTFTGTANSCPVHPREVYQRAILVGATALLVSHNHPSGTREPSEEDLRVTKSLKSAGELLGIKLLDHIIVASNSHYSFCEMGSL